MSIQPQPILPPDVAADYKAWQQAMEAMGLDLEELHKLLLALKTMKNALFGCQEVINQLMTVNGDKVAGLSAVDKFESDLRTILQNAQSDYNNAINGYDNKDNKDIVPTPTPQQDAYMQDMFAQINSLQAILNWQSSLPPDQQILDSGNISNMQDAISNISTAFGSSWGDGTAMAGQVNLWVFDIYNGGSPNPDQQNVTNGFQTINQSVSALSTTTNTDLQFTTEEYKQYMGILQSTQDAYLKFTAQSVQNQKTN